MQQPKFSALEVVSDIDADFTEWYRLYPRKVAPEAARRAYRSARKRGASRQALLMGLGIYIAQCKSTEKRFIAHPSTWLNGSRWLDEEAATDDFAEPWHKRMEMWQKKRIWVGFWGPRPGENGCLVPKNLLV